MKTKIKPVTVQEAIRILDRTEVRQFADAIIGNLELGYFDAGLDESGELHFRITEAGKRHVENMADGAP